MADENILKGRYKHISSNQLVDGKPKVPTAEMLHYGEIAVNYAAGYEQLTIKNSNNEVIPIATSVSVQNLNAVDALAAHEARNDNPHGVTKEQIGLGNVDNTSDAEMPVSTLQQAALDLKLDKTSIVNDLTTGGSTSPLSAAQGVELKKLLQTMQEGGGENDLAGLISRVNSVEEEIKTCIAYIDDTLAPKAKALIDESV